MHLEVARSITRYVKDKWNDFQFDPESLTKFANSLCDTDEIPDDPIFGFVSNVTTINDEMCEVGVTCNEDGSSISEQGKND